MVAAAAHDGLPTQIAAHNRCKQGGVPSLAEPGLITAALDPEEITRSRFDLDVVGLYARPDIFSLAVDETPRPGTVFTR